MNRNRPFGVTLLAILVAIAAIIAIFHTLQMLHLFPIRGPFGVFSFFTFNLLGAILWGILALIYIWVVRMLWNLDPRGWIFVAVIATINLVLAVVSIIGQSTWQAMLPAILVNGLILIYCLLPGTKDAFGMSAAASSTRTSTVVPPASEEVFETKVAPAMAAAVVAEEGLTAPEEEPTATDEDEDLVPEMAAAVVVEEGLTAPEKTNVAEEDESMAPEMAAAVVMEEEIISSEEEAPPEAEDGSLAPEAAAAVKMVEETSAETDEKMTVTGAAALTRDLSYVEGIGEVYSGKLKEAGVDTPQALLERGSTPQGRKELAEVTGISDQLILKWVGEVDLYRIKGLGTQYSELLKAAGVDTVPELAQRNPKNLHAKLVEVNDEFQRVRHLPSQAQIEDWVKQAKELPRVVSY